MHVSCATRRVSCSRSIHARAEAHQNTRVGGGPPLPVPRVAGIEGSVGVPAGADGRDGFGVFGGGVFSRTRAGAPDAPLWVEYDRVARFGASVRLIVHARPQPDGSVRFTLARSLLEALRIQHVTPLPASTSIVGDGVEYRFQAAASGSVPVIFEMQPATRWTVQGHVQSPDGSVQFTQLILP